VIIIVVIAAWSFWEKEKREKKKERKKEVQLIDKIGIATRGQIARRTKDSRACARVGIHADSKAERIFPFSPTRRLLNQRLRAPYRRGVQSATDSRRRSREIAGSAAIAIVLHAEPAQDRRTREVSMVGQ